MENKINDYYKDKTYIRLFTDYMKLLQLDFSLGETVLLSYITALSMQWGHCSANDNYFAKNLNMKKRNIQNYLKHLESANFIKRYFEGNTRIIEVNYKVIEEATQNIA